MKFYRPLLIVALLSFALIQYSHAVKYSGLYTFGDSLSSDGDNAITPGLVWPQYLADSILQPGAIYNDYAVPGARVEEVLDTVKQYLSDSVKADPNAIYALWAGTNNGSTGSSGNIAEAASLLSAAGAKNILVLNLHPNPRRSTGFLIGYNTAMRNRLNTLSANVIQVDTFSLFNELYADPTVYGFANATAVLSDALHFPTQTHEIVSDYIVSVMEAPSLISLLPEIVLPSVREHQTAVLNHLGSLKGNSQENSFIPWVSYVSGTGDGEEGSLTSAFDHDVTGFLGGVDFQWTENLIVGLDFEKNQTQGDFTNRGQYDLDTTLTSFSALFSFGKFFTQGMLTKGSLSFNEVLRTIPLGIATRSMKGTPSGDITALNLNFGMELLQADKDKPWTLGPIVSLSQQTVTIDGYVEDDIAASTSMNFEEQERESFLASGGLSASYDTETSLGAMRAYTHLFFEKELEDSPRTIRGGVNTLSGSSFSMPGVEPESQATRLGVGLQTNLLHGITGQISFEFRNGDSSSDKTIRIEVRKIF